VTQVADLLASSGLWVEVQAPAGLLARAGSGVDTPLGGSPAVVGTLALLGVLVVRAAWRRSG